MPSSACVRLKYVHVAVFWSMVDYFASTMTIISVTSKSEDSPQTIWCISNTKEWYSRLTVRMQIMLISPSPRYGAVLWLLSNRSWHLKYSAPNNSRPYHKCWVEPHMEKLEPVTGVGCSMCSMKHWSLCIDPTLINTADFTFSITNSNLLKKTLWGCE